jgi:class 3 adenylate cyclase/tetratricopeptide (TPR) repeat protein
VLFYSSSIFFLASGAVRANMAESIPAQIEKLRLAIAGLEAQRNLLGDAIVDPTLEVLRKQLVLLEEQAAGADAVATSAVIEQVLPTEERRMVTILFVDMVGSTSMAEKLDPEEWRQIVAKLHTALGEAVSAHHGNVAQYLGDGLLAFFGAKEASEEDPENAIRAALDGQTAVTSLLPNENVQLRAGIHTGLVVVGELGGSAALGETAHKEFTASGDAMNLAARLQSAAPPGGVLISHDTYRYVRGVFDLTPRPPLIVKGKSEPLQTYLVRRAKPRPFRSVARGVAGIETRTIGREVETLMLQQAYLRSYQGHGLVWAQLVSDPGVGKSRLMADLNEWVDLREETVRLLRARAFSDDVAQPFALVRRLWFDRFQISEDTPLEQAEAKWVEHFREFSGLDEESAHALGLLVGLPFDHSPYIKAMRNDPTQVKGRALVVSREVFKSVRRQYPVVVLLEDLQWMDTASWDYLMDVFLGGIKEQGSIHSAEGQDNELAMRSLHDQGNGLFVLGATRLEWQPPEPLVALFKESSPAEKGYDTSGHEVSVIAVSETEKPAPVQWGTLIHLAPLTDQDIRELARELLQRVRDIPEPLLDLLVERSEGVPYFTEEMVNWFIDHAILDTHGEEWRFLPDKLKEQPLPATLQHLLLTRLSSLSQPERATLQRGAIFGRRFWTGGVEALGISDGAETLGHLQPRGFVEVQSESSFQGDTEWSFHQNLLQEVTYESVLKRERAELHRVAATWLEHQAHQAGRLDEFAGLLGEHYERAGELSTAADWFLRAGRRAYGQGAPREAVNFYTQALELLPPVDRDRRWQALLDREEALGVLGNAQPWKADTTALVELAHNFSDENYLAEAYLRQTIFAMRSGEAPLSEQACQAALATAQRCGNEVIEAKAFALIAVSALDRGDQNTLTQNIEAALSLARRLEDENLMSFVLYRAAFCYSGIGDTRCIPLQIEQIELDHRLGNRNQEAMGLGNLGSGFVTIGQYKQARSLLEQASAIDEALGARRSLAYNLMNLGEIFHWTGDLRKARQLNEQALQEISPSQDARGKVFILNNLGKILVAMGDGHAAFRRFSEAHELANSQGYVAQACESTTGLAASSILQGQLDEARRYVHEAWNYLKEHGWVGMADPGTVFRSLAETFDALGEVENFRVVLESSHQAFMEVADKFNAPEWRQSFLENIPNHRWLIEMWERSR